MMKLKLKPIHLFIILLGSLLLCGVLGGVCSTKEGMATGSYVGSAGDTVVVEAPPGKESELDSMRSTTSDETNDGETRFGSLLTSIGNDFDSVKKGVKSLGSDVVGDYDYFRDNVESRISPQVQNKPIKRTHSSGNDRQYVRRSFEIPYSQIPAGDEDLYILKSQVVPPVCPACPSGSTCPRQEPPPPCPPCARCPEPSFECKKVPNYSSNNNQYLPRPVLTDFSQFGM